MADIFPPEIFDTILDHVYLLDEEAKSNYYALDCSLQRDSIKPVKTLLRCSLVCRSWLPRTRLHTFDSIYLPHYDRTIGVTFGALVAHPLCTFRSHVRRLSLQESYSHNFPGEGFWINSVLPQLALLTHVEDVSIYNAHFTNVAEEEWRAGLPLFGPQVKRLDMQSMYFDRVSRMSELVSRCTNLESLALRYIFLDNDVGAGAPQAQGDDMVITTPSSRILQSLSLQYGIAISAEFLTWLCATPGSMKILTVELGCVSIEDAHHVARFLYDIGQSITSLAIDFWDTSDSKDGQDAFCRVADLTTLTKLETLRFGYAGRGLLAKQVPSILAKLNSPCLLKEIRFHLMMDKAADLEMIDWENIVIRPLEVLSFDGAIEEVNLEEVKTWLQEHVGERLNRNVEIRFYMLY
ncbi:hypothetical protein BDZ89DRAFT_1077532 [Hymenopellis radicata]|nr:hypothetical protein BDZ89DRAFT_1077532 [Hymenopellis radicata]